VREVEFEYIRRVGTSYGGGGVHGNENGVGDVGRSERVQKGSYKYKRHLVIANHLDPINVIFLCIVVSRVIRTRILIQTHMLMPGRTCSS